MGWSYIPGVPAAGHISTNGFWHPGNLNTCPKSPCSEENKK
jgi:hypothetical protein